MSRGKIKVFYLDHSNDFSGGQKSLLVLLSLLDRSKIDPTVIIDIRAIKTEKELQKLNIPYVKINYLNIRYLEYILVPIVIARLLILIKKLKCDLLHCNTFKSGLIGSALTFFSKTPVIFRARLGIVVLSHGFLDNIIFKRAHLILANSHYVKDTFTKRFGQSEKVKVIYNPLVEKITINLEVQAAFRKKYFSDPSFYFGLIGRIEPFKRLHDVVEAVRILSERSKNFKVLFIGANPVDGGEEYFQVLQSEIKKNKLEQFFEFTGFVSEIHEITSLLNCVMLCTEGEALSRGVYESQLLGVPVIASDSGGNPELVIHEKTGLLFKPGEIADLAEKMYTIIQNKKLTVSLSYQASLLVKDLFAAEHTVEREIKEYEILTNPS